jgi:hypothetical protein
VPQPARAVRPAHPPPAAHETPAVLEAMAVLEARVARVAPGALGALVPGVPAALKAPAVRAASWRPPWR